MISSTDVVLTMGLCAAAGAAIGLATSRRRLAGRLLAADVAGERWHRRHGEERERRQALEDEVAELAYVIHDGQRRWGFDLARWPAVQELAGDPSPAAVSRFLIEFAPGIRALRDGGRATDRFAA
jgi:hypothetical protein